MDWNAKWLAVGAVVAAATVGTAGFALADDSPAVQASPTKIAVASVAAPSERVFGDTVPAQAAPEPAPIPPGIPLIDITTCAEWFEDWDDTVPDDVEDFYDEWDDRCDDLHDDDHDDDLHDDDRYDDDRYDDDRYDD